MSSNEEYIRKIYEGLEQSHSILRDYYEEMQHDFSSLSESDFVQALEEIVQSNLKDAHAEIQRQLSALPNPSLVQGDADTYRYATLKAAMDYLLFGHPHRRFFEISELCFTGTALGWKPILYLRSFELAEAFLAPPEGAGSQEIFKTTESFLYNALRSLGYPALALTPVSHITDFFGILASKSHHPLKNEIEQLSLRKHEDGLELLSPFTILTCADEQWKAAFDILSQIAHLTVTMLTKLTPGIRFELEIIQSAQLLRRLLLIIPFTNGYLSDIDNREQTLSALFQIIGPPPKDISTDRLFAVYYDDEGDRHHYAFCEDKSIDPSLYNYVEDAVKSFRIRSPDCNWFEIPHAWFTIPYSWRRQGSL